MRLHYTRTTRSLSPQPIPQYARRESLMEHVDSLLARSRLQDEVRAASVDRFVDMDDLPTMRTSSIVCPSLSPWNTTGEYYYPRYPESWRGTAATIPPRRDYYYWTNPGRYYRYRSYYPRYYHYPSRRYVPSYLFR